MCAPVQNGGRDWCIVQTSARHDSFAVSRRTGILIFFEHTKTMINPSKSPRSLLSLVAPTAPQLQTYAEPYDGQAPSTFMKNHSRAPAIQASARLTTGPEVERSVAAVVVAV